MSGHVEEILTELRTNTREGATALAARGLDALKAIGPFLPPDPSRAREAVFHLALRIGESRPSMGAIGVQALLACAQACELMTTGQVSSWPEAMQRAVETAHASLSDADAKIAAFARQEIGAGATIVTCSFSSTVLHTLTVLSPAHLLIGEGHPISDGTRAADTCATRGFDTTLISDTALPAAVEAADAVVIGADQVLRDGAVVNRSASFSLALAARHFKVPFYVVCQRMKITGLTRKEISIERCEAAFPNCPPHVAADAPLFDITPADLISKIITEEGVLTGTRLDALSAIVATIRADAAAMRCDLRR